MDDVVVTCGAVARKRRDTSMLKRGQRQSAHPFQYDRARSKRGATDSHVIIIVFHITLPWKDDADLTTNDNFMYAIFDAVSNEIATGTGLNLIGLTPSNCIHDAWPLMVCAVGELPSYFGGGVNCGMFSLCSSCNLFVHVVPTAFLLIAIVSWEIRVM